MSGPQLLLGEKEPQNFAELVEFVFRHYKDNTVFPKIVRRRGARPYLTYIGIDPVNLVYETAQLVWDYNFRQKEDSDQELPLNWLWRFRKRFAAIGVLQMDPRESTLEGFKRDWVAISLDRDLARETLDAACLIRTIYSRHTAAQDLDPFWFTFDARGGKDLLHKIFGSGMRTFTGNYKDYARRAALRSAPASSLIKTARILAEQKHTMDIPKTRLVYFLVLREIRHRLLGLGESRNTLGNKPKRSKDNTTLNDAELAHIQKLAGMLAQKQMADPVWRIGNADYLRANPIPRKREMAAKAVKITGSDQMVMKFATITVQMSGRDAVTVPVRTGHDRARKGAGGKFQKTTRLTQSELRHAQTGRSRGR